MSQTPPWGRSSGYNEQMTHLGVPPLLTLDVDWLRQAREQPVQLPQDDWLDILLVSLQVFQAKRDAGMYDEGGAAAWGV